MAPSKRSLAQRLKRQPGMQDTQVWSLGWEDPLEKEMAIHSSTLAWRIPWMEEPGRLQSMGSQRVRHNWATSLHFTSLQRKIRNKRLWSRTFRNRAYLTQWVLMDNAAHTCVKMFMQHFHKKGEITRSEIAGSYGSSIFSFCVCVCVQNSILFSIQYAIGSTNLHSHPQCARFLFTPILSKNCYLQTL